MLVNTHEGNRRLPNELRLITGQAELRLTVAAEATEFQKEPPCVHPVGGVGGTPRHMISRSEKHAQKLVEGADDSNDTSFQNFSILVWSEIL